jgi:hypothetical protein
MSQQIRHTSQEIASLAAGVLQDGRFSDEAKSLAASALSQSAGGNRKTSHIIFDNEGKRSSVALRLSVIAES